MRNTTFLILAILLVPALCLGAIIKGPFLQNPTVDGITICWETGIATPDSVAWGETQALGNVVNDPAAVLNHEHRIDGLDPDKVYYYQATHNGDPGAIKTFATAAETCSPFNFVLIGDSRSGHIVHKINARNIEAIYPDFVINTGDIVDHQDSAFGNEMVWQIHFSIERSLMSQVPLYPVMGNHDTGTEGIWERVFAPPSEGSGSELYYSFTYGNSLFVIVNSNEPYITGTAQYDWLEGVLAAGQANPEVLHIFVSFHVPPYSAGRGINQDLVDHLVPLFETYGVQAVLNGHDHHFQHLEQNGVRYFVSGGSGASLYSKETELPQLVKFSKRFHYVLFKVNGADVSIEVFETFSDRSIYTFSWTDDMNKDPCPTIDDDDDDDDTTDDDDTDDDDVGPDDDDDQGNDDDESIVPDEDDDASSSDDDDDGGGCCGA